MSAVLKHLHTALPLVAILRGIRPAEIEAHVATLIDAGFGYIEIPTNSPDWTLSVAKAAKLADNNALIGAGTVTDIAQLRQLNDGGGRLMVSPNTDPALIRTAVASGLLCAAGFATPSEAFAALQAGAQMLKLFPAEHYGTGYVRALRSVLPAQTPLLAVGGIGMDNLAAFLTAGCTGAGFGNRLYVPGQAVEVTRTRARELLQRYRSRPAPAIVAPA